MATAQTMACPFCAEEIRAEAIKCKFCGETLSAGDTHAKKKPESYITPKTVLIALVVLVVLLGFGLLVGGDPAPHPHRYPWQRTCDDRCATALGGVYMKKYDGYDCEELRNDRLLWLSLPRESIPQYEERMAAITDRIAYERCP
ncbi:hypothetical protein HY478_02995 [Candidatus Uhrbacteria bacterium]|nr:hypothetical protein [Candidatus Uhrbacteria bacterium]